MESPIQLSDDSTHTLHTACAVVWLYQCVLELIGGFESEKFYT